MPPAYAAHSVLIRSLCGHVYLAKTLLCHEARARHLISCLWPLLQHTPTHATSRYRWRRKEEGGFGTNATHSLASNLQQPDSEGDGEAVYRGGGEAIATRTPRTPRTKGVEHGAFVALVAPGDGARRHYATGTAAEVTAVPLSSRRDVNSRHEGGADTLIEAQQLLAAWSSNVVLSGDEEMRNRAEQNGGGVGEAGSHCSISDVDDMSLHDGIDDQTGTTPFSAILPFEAPYTVNPDEQVGTAVDRILSTMIDKVSTKDSQIINEALTNYDDHADPLSNMRKRHEKAKATRQRRQEQYDHALKRKQDEKEKQAQAKTLLADELSAQKKAAEQENRLIDAEAKRIKAQRKRQRAIKREALGLLENEKQQQQQQAQQQAKQRKNRVRNYRTEGRPLQQFEVVDTPTAGAGAVFPRGKVRSSSRPSERVRVLHRSCNPLPPVDLSY